MLVWVGAVAASSVVDRWVGELGDGRYMPLGGLIGLLMMVAAVPLYMVGLRFWYRRVDRRADEVVPDVGVALTGAVMSAAFWYACVVVMYGLFAGDPAPGTEPPSAAQVYRQEAVAAAFMLLVFAAAAELWRRLLLRRR